MSRCPSPGECLCSEVDSMEYLKCGPCKKCIKRAVDMESTMQFNCKSDDHSGQENETSNQLRAVMTRSKVDEDNQNLWTSWKGGHSKGQLSKMQENDRDIALVLNSLRHQRVLICYCLLLFRNTLRICGIHWYSSIILLTRSL